jgi:hypothetical protein
MQALGTSSFSKEVLIFRMKIEGRSYPLSSPSSDFNDYKV